jgi:hypothetical protein
MRLYLGGWGKVTLRSGLGEVVSLLAIARVSGSFSRAVGSDSTTGHQRGQRWHGCWRAGDQVDFLKWNN